MIIDTKQVEATLLNKAISGYSIWKDTGISEASISRLRSGKKQFKDLSIGTVIRVQKWIDAREDIN